MKDTKKGNKWNQSQQLLVFLAKSGNDEPLLRPSASWLSFVFFVLFVVLSFCC